jgi:hypothetical protein
MTDVLVFAIVSGPKTTTLQGMNLSPYSGGNKRGTAQSVGSFRRSYSLVLDLIKMFLVSKRQREARSQGYDFFALGLGLIKWKNSPNLWKGNGMYN